MNTKTVKSFVKGFLALVKGDTDEAKAEKVFRQAQSALNTQIAVLTGDSVRKEDAVSEAKEALEKARVNNGELISDRERYVRNILDAKNTLTYVEEELEKHVEKLAFLKGELTNLEKDVEVETEA